MLTIFFYFIKKTWMGKAFQGVAQRFVKATETIAGDQARQLIDVAGRLLA